MTVKKRWLGVSRNPEENSEFPYVLHVKWFDDLQPVRQPCSAKELMRVINDVLEREIIEIPCKVVP